MVVVSGFCNSEAGGTCFRPDYFVIQSLRTSEALILELALRVISLVVKVRVVHRAVALHIACF